MGCNISTCGEGDGKAFLFHESLRKLRNNYKINDRFWFGRSEGVITEEIEEVEESDNTTYERKKRNKHKFD